MNAWQLPQPTHPPQTVSKRALFSWGLVLVVALSSGLVQVLNGKVWRGEAVTADFHLVPSMVPPSMSTPR